jgi:hypothetical protein
MNRGRIFGKGGAGICRWIIALRFLAGFLLSMGHGAEVIFMAVRFAYCRHGICGYIKISVCLNGVAPCSEICGTVILGFWRGEDR